MIYMFSSIFILSILVTFVNTSYAKMGNCSDFDIFKMSLVLLPLQYLIGLGYAYYYSKGIQFLSYSTLTVSAYPITIGMGVIVGTFIFKTHTFSVYEMLGLAFTFLGLICFSLNKIQGV